MKYIILESLFKIRHYVFESFSTGNLKHFLRRNTFKYIKRLLFDKKIKNNYIFPENIVIETASICNAKCWFCPQPTMTRKNSYMKFELFKKYSGNAQPHLSREEWQEHSSMLLFSKWGNFRFSQVNIFSLQDIERNVCSHTKHTFSVAKNIMDGKHYNCFGYVRPMVSNRSGSHLTK